MTPFVAGEQDVADRYARTVDQLRTLMELSGTINSSLETGEIRRRSVEAASHLVGAERSSLLLLDGDTGELCFEVALGDTGGALKKVRLQRGQGIAGWVVETGECALVSDVEHDPRFQSGLDSKAGFRTRDMLCVPVRLHERTIGALQSMNKQGGSFDDRDRELLCALAHQVAVAIENANLYAELKEAFYETAAALANTLDKRDPYTGGHTQRVTRYAEVIGRRLGLSEEEMEHLRLSAALHDIGKIGVPDAVLLKPGRLSDAEYAVMCEHPACAGEILAHVHQLGPVMPGVVGHHERYDGKGYPRGAAGEEIPVQARIIAVADTFDAMTTDRPYRARLSDEAASAELRAGAGTQFDPAVVDAFLDGIPDVTAGEA